MSEQLQRLVDLVPYLWANQGVSVQEAAEEFGVKPKRILDDLAILQFVGLPGGLHGDLFEMDVDGARSDGLIFVSNVEALGRPMRLSSEQAASLLVALQLVIDLGGNNEAALSAKAKIEAVTKEPPPVTVNVEPGDAPVLSALATALEAKRLVTLTYKVGGRGAPRQALVEPHALRTDSGYAYLDAWSRAREGWRTYRVDRIQDVQVLDERFDLRDVPAELSDWFSESTRQVTFVVTEQGRWIADYYPTLSVEERPGHVEVTFPVVSEDWAAKLWLRLGTEALDISDRAIIEHARRLAEETLEHYHS